MSGEGRKFPPSQPSKGIVVPTNLTFHLFDAYSVKQKVRATFPNGKKNSTSQKTVKAVSKRR